MQATVSMWDEGRRSARVVPHGAVDEAGLVRLARGQRLSIDLADVEHREQVVTRIRLLG